MGAVQIPAVKIAKEIKNMTLMVQMIMSVKFTDFIFIFLLVYIFASSQPGRLVVDFWFDC